MLLHVVHFGKETHRHSTNLIFNTRYFRKLITLKPVDENNPSRTWRVLIAVDDGMVQYDLHDEVPSSLFLP